MKEKIKWSKTELINNIECLEKFKSKFGYYPHDKETKESLEFYKSNPGINNFFLGNIDKRTLDQEIKELKEKIKIFEVFVKDMKEELKELQYKKKIAKES